MAVVLPMLSLVEMGPHTRFDHLSARFPIGSERCSAPTLRVTQMYRRTVRQLSGNRPHRRHSREVRLSSFCGLVGAHARCLRFAPGEAAHEPARLTNDEHDVEVSWGLVGG